MVVRAPRLRRLRHLFTTANGRHDRAHGDVPQRRLQRRRLSDCLRRADTLGEIRLRLQRADVPPAVQMALERARDALVSALLLVLHADFQQSRRLGIYLHILRHGRGDAALCRELHRHRTFPRPSGSSVPAVVRNLDLITNSIQWGIVCGILDAQAQAEREDFLDGAAGEHRVAAVLDLVLWWHFAALCKGAAVSYV